MAQADYSPHGARRETRGGSPLRRADWLRGQNQAFRAALDGAPLAVSLGILTEIALAGFEEGVRCAFYMPDEAGATLRHVVGMPESYARQVDGCRIGADSLACGLAVGTAESVITPDVRQEPQWSRWLWLAEEYGYRGCWSFPVETTAAELVGTFALYFPGPREARAEDLELADALTGCAAIVIAQYKSRETLGRSEEKYRALFESMDEAYAVVEVLRDAAGKWADFRFLEVNPAFIEHTSLPNAVGMTATELLGSPNPRWAELYGEALDTGKPLRVEESEGTLGRTFDLNIFSLDRTRNRVAVLFTNITERKQTERALRDSETRAHLLLAELQHRARNILAVVRSVFTRTVETGGEIEAMAEHFRGRLDALARTQVVVTQSARGTADLENLVREELLSVGAGDGPRLAIAGPEVDLAGETAEAMGLAVHELTTNSIKYGALRFSEGSLAIRWLVNLDYGGGPRLVFIWEEQGVPAVPVDPGREGFGTELITRALPYRLGAETRLELRPGGVHCLIALPLEGAALARGLQ